MNIRKNTIITLTILLVSMLNSCATRERMSGLEKRINSLYQAETSGNWKEWYEIMWLERRRGVVFDEFVTMWNKRDFSIVSWEIKSIRSIERPSGESFQVDEATAVSMDVVVEYADGRRETALYKTDYWVKEQNEWYWNWRE